MAVDLTKQRETEKVRRAKWLLDNFGACDRCDMEEEIDRQRIWEADHARAYEALVAKLSERAARPEAPKRVRKNKPAYSREWLDDRNALRRFDRQQHRAENARRKKWDADNLGACDQDDIDEEQARRRQWDDDHEKARQNMIDEGITRRRASNLTRMTKHKLTGHRAVQRAAVWAHYRWQDSVRKTAVANKGATKVEVYETHGEKYRARIKWQRDLVKRAKQIAAEKLSYKQDVKVLNTEQDNAFWETATRYIVADYEKVGDTPTLAALQEQIGFQL
jgi:hypothetical protein